MQLIDFIKEFSDKDSVSVCLDFLWEDSGLDENLCFEGTPNEFVENYTNNYDCIKGLEVSEVYELTIKRIACRLDIFIGVVRK